MKKLKIPSLTDKVKEIYIECANDFTHNKKYANVALSYVDEVEKCSNEYTVYIPDNIAKFPYIIIYDEEKEIINKVYEQKFAPKGSIGRKYYDSIIGNAKGRCPICGGGKFKNGFDASLNPGMWRKYEAHMRINDLAAIFNSRAEEELENIRGHV